MKTIFILINFIFLTHAYSYELNEIYYFPEKGKSELIFNASLKEFEIEYDESSAAVAGSDIQEFDQQVLVFTPIYKYSITDNFLIDVRFHYQSKDIETYFEGPNDTKFSASTKNGLFDPRVKLRYRVIKKNTVFLDAILDQTFKTNTYVEGNQNKSAQPYSGKYTTTISSEIGYKFKRIMLKTHLSMNLHSKLEKEYMLFPDKFKADFTYSVGFGGTVLLRASENFNISGSFTSISVNAHTLKSQDKEVHIDKILSAIIMGKVEYKGFENSIGRLNLSYGIDGTKNRLRYNNTVDIFSDTTAFLTTLGIDKRF